ncbi:hypothetical protein FACS1894211_08590 [Clostridia bacterium]|nr:hypothetical protein FACS1894211_08590 [Clostridia bacterium]
MPLKTPARISGVHLNGFEARRMTEYGFVVGTPVVALFRSLGGNLTAFEIRGAVVALRKSTSGGIKIATEKRNS